MLVNQDLFLIQKYISSDRSVSAKKAKHKLKKFASVQGL